MTRPIAYVLLLMAVLPSVARAQASRDGRVALTTGIAYTSQWDDETHLGNGVLLSVGVSTVLRSAIRVEGEIALARHTRDSGYLEAEGTPVVGTVRAAWLIGPSRWQTRPFVSLGGTLTHSRGELRWTEISAGPDGRPVQTGVTVHPWRITEPGFELGAGMEIRGAGRMWWRPEIRIGATRGNRNYQPGVNTLETPILTARAGLTVGW